MIGYLPTGGRWRKLDRVKLDSAALAAQTILESSGETYRAEDTALRMCAAFGLSNAQIMAFPTGFVLTATGEGALETKVFRVSERSMRLDRIDEVNLISRQVTKGELTAQEAYERLLALRAQPPQPPLKACLYYALAAAFFTVMLGGGFTEFSLSFAIGFLVQTAQAPLAKMMVPSQLRSFLLGFLSALIAGLALTVLKADQEALITGIIIPLLPGLAMTNAIRDTIRGDLISGLARGAEALISAVLLSAGVAAALWLKGMLWIA